MRILQSLQILVLAAASLCAASPDQPNFTGIWKLTGGKPQAVIIDQTETDVRFVEFAGDRLRMLRGPIDGQPHWNGPDTAPCSLRAQWQGDSLFLETECRAHDTAAASHVQYVLRLERDGETVRAKRTSLAPTAATADERWERQDPPHPELTLTGFDMRRTLDAAGLEVAEGSQIQGLLGYAFNDVTEAERGYLHTAKAKRASQDREEAILNLTYTYARNGLIRKALQVCPKADRAFYKQLAKYPEMTVAHHGESRLQSARDPEGRLLIPMTIAGKDARYLVDTGSSESLIRMSEARRLGLKLQKLTRENSDGMTHWKTTLTVVPSLTVGETRLENVPFWVAPDDRLNWPGFAGVIGIDVLLKLVTLRWEATGVMEVGFAPQEKDLRRANLCFGENTLFLLGSSGSMRLSFFLDTGDNATFLYPRFAMEHLDLLAAHGLRSPGDWNAHGAHAELVGINLPEMPLSVGGMSTTLQPAPVLLQKVIAWERHGTIGIDLLNRARRVTLDLHAMRLTLE